MKLGDGLIRAGFDEQTGGGRRLPRALPAQLAILHRRHVHVDVYPVQQRPAHAPAVLLYLPRPAPADLCRMPQVPARATVRYKVKQIRIAASRKPCTGLTDKVYSHTIWADSNHAAAVGFP